MENSDVMEEISLDEATDDDGLELRCGKTEFLKAGTDDAPFVSNDIVNNVTSTEPPGVSLPNGELRMQESDCYNSAANRVGENSGVLDCTAVINKVGEEHSSAVERSIDRDSCGINGCEPPSDSNVIVKELGADNTASIETPQCTLEADTAAVQECVVYCGDSEKPAVGDDVSNAEICIMKQNLCELSSTKERRPSTSSDSSTASQEVSSNDDAVKEAGGRTCEMVVQISDASDRQSFVSSAANDTVHKQVFSCVVIPPIQEYVSCNRQSRRKQVASVAQEQNLAVSVGQDALFSSVDSLLLQELADGMDVDLDEIVPDLPTAVVVPNGVSEAAILKLHPLHQKLQAEMVSLQWKCKQQAEEITKLKNENQKLDNELDEKTMHSNTDIYEVQMEALEKSITQLQRELEATKEKLAGHDEVAKRTIAQLKHDLGGKVDQLTKMYESANRDKEMMVIKYAQSQKEVLNLKKVLEDLDKKMKDSAKEKELMLMKLKNMNTERSRLCIALDAKGSELSAITRESEKQKEQITSKDIKIKWAQNKLRTEIEAHKETELKLERVQQKLQQTREEAEQIRRDCQEMIRTYQESEDIKSNSLDIQLKEKSSELQLHLQEKNDQEEVYQVLRRELDAIKRKHKLSLEESNNLTMKLHTLERERLDYEKNLSRLRETVNSHKQEIVDLTSKLAEMENLKALLEREKEKNVASQNETVRMRQANQELQTDMEACRSKEGELLEFTERLTSKNVTLQSEFASLEAKYQMLQSEHSEFGKLNDDLQIQLSTINKDLEEEKQMRQQETQLLARKLAEKTKAVESLTLKLDEETNENRVMKRRHISSVRELTREVQQLKRKLDAAESTNFGNPDALSASSRASSSCSLDAMANNNGMSGMNNPSLPSQAHHGRSGITTNGPVMSNAVQRTHQQMRICRYDNHSPNVVTLEPSKQLLIDRIVKLQRSLARKNEKIEFLEEHATQLLLELKKKSRIIQAYIMKMETGALATERMDQNKPASRSKNKMDLARRGGIMASVYSSHAIDGGLTLELSLEINHKLQAVLEDTLLKNITLKENINTLGDEIARLIADRPNPRQPVDTAPNRV